MYLEKLTVQGFKSFANKNELEFVGMLDKTKRGITAVVGPNGSGKSNVADAIRWALGEQSMKSLRGKKSEDVIFSGSDKKGKLGMAEVSLHLNNEDGKAPIDYSQLVLTRRLYRNGESEYLINNNRVRLSDVQMLLAKSKFGQKTYSVIGQGTVEGFLNSSLAERKEFFDEATGIKQFQIKRDESLNKLKASYENLNQAEMLLTEIEPRLKSLTRQVNKLQKREELEKELKNLRLVYYRSVWHNINDEFNQLNKQYQEQKEEKEKKDRAMEALNQSLQKLEAENSLGKEFDEWQRKLNTLQVEKNNLDKKIARLEAEKEVDLESRGQFDLSFLSSKSSELNSEIRASEQEIEDINKEIETEEEGLRKVLEQKKEIEERVLVLEKDIKQNQEGAKEETGFSGKISEAVKRLIEAENSQDIDSIKGIIIKVRNDLEELTLNEQPNKNQEKVEQLRIRIDEALSEKESILNKISEKKLRVASKKERLSLKTEKKEHLKRDLASIDERLNQNKDKLSEGEIEEALKKYNQELEVIDNEIGQVKIKIEEISKDEEKKRSKLFDIQRNAQALQAEINTTTNKLNETKINSTKRETRLEDLEVEIVQNLGSVDQIKSKRVEGEVNQEELREKINNTRKQLEHIGGIDPEVETEYINTKERFDFIDSQVKDLVETIKALEKVIKELDETIREIFDKEFKIIQAKFEEYFKILFNGGKAKIIKVLEKEEEDEKSETDQNEKKDDQIKPAIDVKKIKFLQKHNATGLAGIEIQATPPGKKISSISMLSGGERALTAIALISAIISANPSPFVVLDEVDAALDEANSERLAKILDDLSHKTQFIVITHNRATMRKASVLYGVTMGDDGISKLLSVKFEEAKSLDNQ